MTRVLSRHTAWTRLLTVWVTAAFVLSTTTVGYATPSQKVEGEPGIAIEAPAAQPAAEPEAPAEETIPEPEAVPVEEPAPQPAQPEAPQTETSEPEPSVSEEPQDEPVLVEPVAPAAPLVASEEIVRTAAVVGSRTIAPATHVTPVPESGNPALTTDGIRLDISDLGDAGSGAKTFYHTIGETLITFTVTVVETSMGMEFSFTSDYPVTRVVAKGGNAGANIYNYNPAVYSDSGLHTPLNPSGKWADISHLDFYFSIVPVEETPGIELVKTVDEETVLAGETVTYTYVVTNTGDIDLHDVEVTDDMLGLIGTIDHLAVGESETLTMDAEIEVDTVNVGTAIGYYGEGESVEDSDDAAVNVIAPAISVVKSVDQELILVGETVTYTYVVTNTGDVDLYDVVLDDDKLGIVGTLEFLAEGASETFTASTSLEVPTTNVVVATGTDEMGHEVTDNDDAFVDVAAPAVVWTFSKSANETTASPGDIVTYTLTYSLAQDSSAYEGPIPVSDDYDERYMTPVDTNGGTVDDGMIRWTDANEQGMQPGESRTITYTMRVDSDMPVGTTAIDNIAYLEVDEPPYTDTWRVTVTVDEPFAPFTPDDDEEPFLPYTGAELQLLVLGAALSMMLGIALRTLGKVEMAKER